MKKVIVALLAILLAYPALSIFSPKALAETKPIMRLSQAEAERGQEVNVTVSLENNPGIVGMTLGFDYDKTRLEDIVITEGGLTGWTIKDRAVWSANNGDVSYNGVILNLKFKVKEDAPLGEAYVTVTYDPEGDITNWELEDLVFEVVPGKINIVCGHIWDEGKITIMPTCTEPGEKLYTCTKCGATKTEPVPAKGHTPDETGWQSDKDGHWQTCGVCGAAISKGAHTYGEWTVVKEPTETEAGEKERVCSVCGRKETEVLPVKLIEKVKVSFDANGGSGEMAAVELDKGTTYILPACKFTAPEGKEFDKWDKGAVGAKIMVNGDVTIKAEWQKKPAAIPAPPVDEPETPETGDAGNMLLWALTGVLSMGGMAAAARLKRKHS